MRTADDILFKITTLLAKGLGLGYIPWMPGTWGSALGVGMVYLVGCDIWWSIGVFLFSWLVIWNYERRAHSHDERQVVIDEISGIFVTFLFVPLYLHTFVAGFLIFRVFDIFKPFPINWIDRNVNTPLGTVLDDVIAGAMSCLTLQIIVYWLEWI